VTKANTPASAVSSEAVTFATMAGASGASSDSRRTPRSSAATPAPSITGGSG
jgi:hypothetical protein